ncbi:mucin-17 [Orussus abietinus]|uniref:mucin-17 n=1 Tax=Orussus abietinus TaxID=222816 RepID=UPI000626279D|nr:mucin-17 [Orussus abietinus]XP_012283437.1 mucin-17 [Orussus abietinus]
MGRSCRWLPLMALLVLANFRPTLALPVPDEELETSTRLLGSSVVTSVSVVTGGDDRHREEVNPSDSRKAQELPASPAGLLRPDRFQFYMYDDRGDIVKKQMTSQQIKTLIAAGGGQLPMDIHEPQKAGDAPMGGTNVADVVQIVQNVLKGELNKPTTVMSSLPTIPGHSNDEWSSILPAILSGDADAAPVSTSETMGEPEKRPPTLAETSSDVPTVQANEESSATTTLPESHMEVVVSASGISGSPAKLPSSTGSPIKETTEVLRETQRPGVVTARPSQDQDLTQEQKKKPASPEAEGPERPMVPVPVIVKDETLPTRYPSGNENPVFQMLNTISAEALKDTNASETKATTVLPVTMSGIKKPAASGTDSTKEAEGTVPIGTHDAGFDTDESKRPVVFEAVSVPTTTASNDGEILSTVSVVAETHSTSMKVSGQPEVPIFESSVPVMADRVKPAFSMRPGHFPGPADKVAQNLPDTTTDNYVPVSTIVDSKYTSTPSSGAELVFGDNKFSSPAVESAMATKLPSIPETTTTIYLQNVSMNGSILPESVTTIVSDLISRNATKSPEVATTHQPAPIMGNTPAGSLQEHEDPANRIGILGTTPASVQESSSETMILSTVGDDQTKFVSTSEPVFHMLPEIRPGDEIKSETTAFPETNSIEKIIESLNHPVDTESNANQNTSPMLSGFGNGNTMVGSFDDFGPTQMGTTLESLKPSTVPTPLDAESASENTPKPFEPLPTELADSLSSMISQISDAVPSILPISQGETVATPSRFVEDVRLEATTKLLAEETTEAADVTMRIVEAAQENTEKPDNSDGLNRIDLTGLLMPPEMEKHSEVPNQEIPVNTTETKASTVIPENEDGKVTVEDSQTSEKAPATEVNITESAAVEDGMSQLDESKPNLFESESTDVPQFETTSTATQISKSESSKTENVEGFKTSSQPPSSVTVPTLQVATDANVGNTITTDNSLTEKVSDSTVSTEAVTEESVKKNVSDAGEDENVGEVPVVRIDLAGFNPEKILEQGINSQATDRNDSSPVNLSKRPVDIIHQLLESAPVQSSTPSVVALTLPKEINGSNIASGLIAGFTTSPTLRIQGTEVTESQKVAEELSTIGPVESTTIYISDAERSSTPEEDTSTKAVTENSFSFNDMITKMTESSKEEVIDSSAEQTEQTKDQNSDSKLELSNPVSEQSSGELEEQTSTMKSAAESVTSTERINFSTMESFYNGATEIYSTSVAPEMTTKKDESKSEVSSVLEGVSTVTPFGAQNSESTTSDIQPEVIAIQDAPIKDAPESQSLSIEKPAEKGEASTTKAIEDATEAAITPTEESSLKTETNSSTEKTNEGSPSIQVGQMETVSSEVEGQTGSPAPLDKEIKSEMKKPETAVVRIDLTPEVVSTELPPMIQLTDLPIIQTVAVTQKTSEVPIIAKEPESIKNEAPKVTMQVSSSNENAQSGPTTQESSRPLQGTLQSYSQESAGPSEVVTEKVTISMTETTQGNFDEETSVQKGDKDQSSVQFPDSESGTTVRSPTTLMELLKPSQMDDTKDSVADLTAPTTEKLSTVEIIHETDQETRIRVNDTAVLVTKHPLSNGTSQKLDESLVQKGESTISGDKVDSISTTPDGLISSIGTEETASESALSPSKDATTPVTQTTDGTKPEATNVQSIEQVANQSTNKDDPYIKLGEKSEEMPTPAHLSNQKTERPSLPHEQSSEKEKKPDDKNDDKEDIKPDNIGGIVDLPTTELPANKNPALEKDGTTSDSRKPVITSSTEATTVQHDANKSTTEKIVIPSKPGAPSASKDKTPISNTSAEKQKVKPTKTPQKTPGMNIKKTDSETGIGAEDKWALIPQRVTPPTKLAKPQEPPMESATNGTHKRPQHQPSVFLDTSQTATGLDGSTKNLDQDIVYFVALCNELAFKFWTSTNKGLSTARSLALSPFGMTSLLAMVFLGARGPTSNQMNDVLKLDDVATFNPHLVFQNVTDTVSLARNQGIANAAFVRELFADKVKVRKLLPFYKEQAQQFYEGIVAEVNFATISDIVRRRTNLLVRKQTGGRIKDFVKTNAIPLRSPLAALSANVFQTDCNTSAASSEGRDGELYFAVSPAVRQRKLVPVPATVWRTGVLAGYEPGLDATTVALGGLDKMVSTIFVIPGQQGHTAPGDSLERLEERLLQTPFGQGSWNKLLKVLAPRPGLELQIPKFSHRSVINATAALKRMGLEELFSKHADLKGINGVGHNFHLADILQLNLFSTCGEENIMSGRHHVEVYPASPLRNSREMFDSDDWSDPTGNVDSENGSQFATNSQVSEESEDSTEPADPDRTARQMDHLEKPRLKLDRPFLYFVRHNPTGLILHMGRFNPRLLP